MCRYVTSSQEWDASACWVVDVLEDLRLETVRRDAIFWTISKVPMHPNLAFVPNAR